jgi:predicted nucleotidyltransferase
MNPKSLALENEILRGIVGSSAHGTAIEGQDDRDEMGVCIEPAGYVLGLQLFEQFLYRTQPEGVRSGPGDLDLTIYSLRKFCRLAAHGNPSIILLLWLPRYLVLTQSGEDLVGIRHAFISRGSAWRFHGYLVAQRMALTGERTKKVSRPELVEQYGYDTKFAMHALRLGLQGIEYISERHLSVPMEEPNLSLCRNVRAGKIVFKDALALIMKAERELKELAERCSIQADYETVNRFLIDAHQRHWSATSKGVSK